MTGEILFYTSEFPPDPGGAGMYMYQMAAHLRAFGHDVRAVVYQGHRPEATIEAFNAAQTFPIVRMRAMRDLPALRAAVRGRRPAVAVTDDPVSLLHLRRVFFGTRARLIAVGHGSEFRQSRLPVRWAKVWLYDHCDHLVANSHFTLERMRAVGIRSGRVTIVHPGGSIDQPDPGTVDALRQRHNIPPGAPVIVTVGALSPRKGQDVMVRALPLLKAQYPDVRYVIVGRDRTDGQMTAMLRQLAAASGIADNVIYAGSVEEAEKGAYYALADVCALLSRNTHVDVEGFGIVVIEAALCGRTTVGTAGTGVAEAILDGQTGLLVPQDDPQRTAAAIQRLLADPDLRARLSAAAEARARSEYNWEARARVFDSVIRQVL
ncbi:MAG: glycosyltransferase family 4 protein [Chloroflexota bacterium]